MLKSQQAEYDVCIVGSGAGGGMAAHRLALGGARVVLLEAGGWWDNTTANSTMLRWPYQTSQRGASTPDDVKGSFNAMYSLIGDKRDAWL